VVEVPRPEPVSSGAGRMADAYWCALQTLTRAVAAGDETVLATVREAMADEALDETARLAFVTQSLAERPGGGRAAAPDFDAAAYLAAHPEVRAAVDEGAVASPYEHYLRIGHARGHPRPGRGGQATVAGVSVYGPGPIRPGDGAVRLSEALQGAPRLLVARPEFQFDLLRMHDDGFLLHPTQWGTSTVAMTLRFPRPVRWLAMRLEAIDGRSLPISFAMRALPGAYPDEAIDPDLSADLTLADPDLLAQLAWTRLVPASSRPVTVEFKTPATEAKLVFATKVDGVEYFSHAHFSNLFFF
jgi:hypothetical protein